jgi:hypothetical protein
VKGRIDIVSSVGSLHRDHDFEGRAGGSGRNSICVGAPRVVDYAEWPVAARIPCGDLGGGAAHGFNSFAAMYADLEMISTDFMFRLTAAGWAGSKITNGDHGVQCHDRAPVS